MKLRQFSLVLVAGFLAAACSTETAEQGEAESAMEMSADETALEQVRADYETHYNMHHASVVADMFTDSAVFLSADGGVHLGKAAIAASLEQAMGGTPTLGLSTGATMVLGDYAVARGGYNVSMTPPGGAPMTVAGHYMTFFERTGGGWKIAAVTTNYNAPPPEGLPRGEGPAEPPPEEGTMTDLVAAYTQHFNLGHADMTAALYTEDAVAAFANRPLAEGRAAIQAALQERMAAGSPQITIHDVGTMDLGNGWAFDGGWYETKATMPEGEVTQTGSYMLLARQMEDGTWKIHWSVTNGQPTSM